MMQQCSHDLHCAIRRVGRDPSVKRHFTWALSAGRFDDSRKRDRGSSHPSAEPRYVPPVSKAGCAQAKLCCAVSAEPLRRQSRTLCNLLAGEQLFQMSGT